MMRQTDPSSMSGVSLGSRAAFLIVFVLLTLIATVFYAGPSFGIVLYRLVTDGGVLLLWLASAAGLGWMLLSFMIAHPPGVAWAGDSLPVQTQDRRGHAPPGDLRAETQSPMLRLATATALGLGILSLAVLGLGLIGWLNALTAWLLIAIGIALGILKIVRNDTPETRAAIAAWFAEPAGSAWLALVAMPLIVVAVVGAMVPPGVLWSPNEPHGYDVVEYHLQVPREWYEAGRITALHHNAFSYFPFNVEMHYLLAMHLRGGPWAGMYLAQLMHGAFILFTIFAVYGFARLRSDRLTSIIATLAAATVPLLPQLAAIAYDEGGLLLFGTLAIGWAMRATFETERRLSRFILAGVMAGFACGAKLTAVPEVLISLAVVCASFALWMWVRGQPQASPKQWLGLLLAGLVAMLVFSPWLLRNVAWAGNPVFPEAARLLGRDGFSEVQVQRWDRAHAVPESERSAAGRARAFWSQVVGSWQFGYVLLPLAIIAFAISIHRPEAWFLFLLLLLLTLFWIGFTHLQGRFYVLAVPIGALLLAEVDWSQFASAGTTVRVGFATVILLAAVVSAVLLNMDLSSRLYGQSPVAMILGAEDFSWATPKEFEKIPSEAPIILVGDARAFIFPYPMSRLRYRTVFDADTSNGRGVIEAWAGPESERKNAWMWIVPEELKRFERTYQPFPPLPDSIRNRDEPFLVPPGDRSIR